MTNQKWHFTTATVLSGILSIFTVSILASDVQIRAAEVVAYGIFESRQERAYSSAFRTSAPAADTVSDIKFTDFTSEIPGVLDTNFGYEFVINSTPKGGRINVEQVIRFPGDGLHRPNGQVYEESRERQTVRIGYPNFYGYGFDEEWEIVPGEWVFEVWYGEARLIRKTFNVVVAEEEEATSN